jgi:serine/threonine-protein kinase
LSLSPGQAFGNYRILSRIGVGGMGMVFLAEHPHIGKRVALKVIHRDLAGNREVVDRFLNEARAVNQIGSEHIVEIHDFGQTEAGEHFFIMEFLDGRTLAHELVAHGLVPVPRALHIGAQVASALAAAHDAGIIHRDLKPDNVMLIERLGDRDFVKLLDFGLAKFLASSDARKLTAAGVVLGTPQYMSPEACESRAVLDHRCDIYSLGVLLFQMLTGALPFQGESMGEVLVKQVAQPPPAPRGLNPDIPPAVEQVVLRCLAKEPAARFQTMRELRDVLLDPAGYLASSPPVVPVAASADARTLYASPGARRSAAVAASPAPDRPTEIALEPGRAPVDWSGRAQAAPSPGDRTAYMDDAAHRMFAGHMERHMPQPVENRTMEIGTPHGYSNRPPRRRLWLAASVAIAAAGAVAVAVVAASGSGDGDTGQGARAAADGREGAGHAGGALPGRGGDSAGPGAPGAASSGGAAAGSAPGGAAAGSAPGAAAPGGTRPRVARIRLTTRPTGAQVTDEAGAAIGTTPTELTLPIDGREVLLRFRHPRAADAEKRFVPTGDAALDIELPPAPVPAAAPAAKPAPETARPSPRAPDKRRSRQRRRDRKNEVLRPEF